MNAHLHITREQAESLLEAVRFEQANLLVAAIQNGRDNMTDKRLNELASNEGMLLAALGRIGDLERRRAPHLRVASVRSPW